MLANYSNDKASNGDQKFILFYNSYFDEINWVMTAETYYEDDLKSMGCPISKCVFTNNKNVR